MTQILEGDCPCSSLTLAETRDRRVLIALAKHGRGLPVPKAPRRNACRVCVKESAP